ncbi:MAG: hypothetical protein A2639_03040 [Candidatus Staskawiczbacteria bacterium RIFCSPHIGHO2_01_FULL_34_27]|uniref:Uncharacterized protein n=1 Tax=Candidatus Staskawiczbacteria bacterium RIFCSPHIGHO2_01_FULL_34_27 TaxID=1802199 RepID=A0A1G2HMN7_9BACT|nr:MAG: hypothetical protein A2639_03040 [Candidatus Staskawiczbacteria bacterium RIFCSPHIGHO2_01_FULL_34_27]
MNIKIIKNKYINTLFILMLFSASVHMLIIFLFFIKVKNIYTLNYFNILDLDLFYNNIFNSLTGNIFSLLFVVFIYFLILKINRPVA